MKILNNAIPSNYSFCRSIYRLKFCKLMKLPSTILLQLRPKYRNLPRDHTSIWSREASRTHPYNRMDPDPDPESDTSPVRSRPVSQKDGKIKRVLTKGDWKKFWVERLRKLVDAPHLTDKDIFDTVERSRRIFLKHREEDKKAHVDPDLPPCFYWTKKEVASWTESVGLPQKIKEMFLHNGICGRHLVTVDATNLQKMGLYELGTIRKVTKAIREVLGLPHTNSLRAFAREPPLETFLKMKIRTGPSMDKFTFKEYCEQHNLQYEPVKKEMETGFEPIPGCCRVEIKPDPKAEVKWIPIKVHKPNKSRRQSFSNFDFQLSDESSSSTYSTSSSDDLLENIPTVEQLCTNLLLRNTFIPTILNDIVETVFDKVAENNRIRKENRKNKQDIANEVVTDQLEKSFSDFAIKSAEDKLKFVTIIAEELVEDVLRAREILEDIDKFQERIQAELPEKDMKNLQQAVAHYVQNIMPIVVSAALKEMEKSSSSLSSELEKSQHNSESPTGSTPSYADSSVRVNAEEEDGGVGDHEFVSLWDRDRTPTSRNDD